MYDTVAGVVIFPHNIRRKFPVQRYKFLISNAVSFLCQTCFHRNRKLSHEMNIGHFSLLQPSAFIQTDLPCPPLIPHKNLMPVVLYRHLTVYGIFIHHVKRPIMRIDIRTYYFPVSPYLIDLTDPRHPRMFVKATVILFPEYFVPGKQCAFFPI